jgi:hypothetical protein
MKTHFAAGCIFLVSAWNAVMAAGSLHDTNHLEPTAQYYCSFFLYSMLAVIGVIASLLLVLKSRVAAPFFALWTIATGVAVGYSLATFLSFAGGYPALLLNLPQLSIGILAAMLLSPGGTLKPLGVAWPFAFALLLVVSIVVHVQVKRAENRVVDDAELRPTYELWIPTKPVFYLRPISIVTAMLAWTMLCLRPVLRTDIPSRPPRDSSSVAPGS